MTTRFPGYQKSIGFFLFVLLFPAYLHGQSLHQVSLYLNAGSFTAVDSMQFPYLAFNPQPVFEPRNAVFHFVTGDTLLIAVTNNDTLPHGFAIQGLAESGMSLAPGTTQQDTVLLSQSGLFIYYDPEAYPRNTYLGAAGMIAVGFGEADGLFYWNIKEHRRSWNLSLAAGQNVDWTTYEPDYFTLNGLSKPGLEGDASAKVRGSVGDTLLIFATNTGRSYHPLHFHGFHVRILYSSEDSRQTDWIKDSLPLAPMESLILELVPDKPGLYPVHDHNLTALTGGGYYPNGIFLMMEIK